jgi:hypothetical protein
LVTARSIAIEYGTHRCGVGVPTYLRTAGLGDGAITVARVEALLSPAHRKVWRLNAAVLYRGQGNGIARSRVP